MPVLWKGRYAQNNLTRLAIGRDSGAAFALRLRDARQDDSAAHRRVLLCPEAQVVQLVHQSQPVFIPGDALSPRDADLCAAPL